MTKLRKTFETKTDPWGFRNSIDVNVNYNNSDKSIDELYVMFYSERFRNGSDITELFETVPEFISLVDNIDWEKIYADKMAARAEKEPEYA